MAGLVVANASKWHGDKSGGPRKWSLQEQADILMTKPKSLEVLLMTGRPERHPLFSCGGLEPLQQVVLYEQCCDPTRRYLLRPETGPEQRAREP